MKKLKTAFFIIVYAFVVGSTLAYMTDITQLDAVATYFYLFIALCLYVYLWYIEVVKFTEYFDTPSE